MLIVFLYTTLCAQGENDNWYFGMMAGVNFSNPTTPVVSNNSGMFANSGCGSISDSNGNLLFYTNGDRIWNRLHQAMPNGNLIPAYQNDDSAQLIIVKNPGNNNQYYVFTTGEYGPYAIPGYTINYSIVDMTLGSIANGSPLGDVVSGSKDIPVLDNLGNKFKSEAITAIANTTDNSYWILIPNGSNLYTYKLDANGFNNGNPIISNLNFPVNLDPLNTSYTIKPSPKIINNNYSHYICISKYHDSAYSPNYINKVYSFNSNTGQITNDFSLVVNSLRSYSPEFNKNASILFLGYKHVYAVDLINSTNSSVQSMEIYHDPYSPDYGVSALQRNKYGDIYFGRVDHPFLAKITNPDVYSPNIGINLTAIDLGSWLPYNAGPAWGLPQLVPTLSETYYPCINDLILTNENNYIFNYEVGNTIITKDHYMIGARHNIIMQAGNSVSLLPGTEMMLGAEYHAFIKTCNNDTSKRGNQHNQKGMVLNLDMEERKALSNQISIYPNPASAYINIDSGNEKILSWELFDVSGRSVLKGSSDKVNVQSLPKANYILKINTNYQEITKKVIVK